MARTLTRKIAMFQDMFGGLVAARNMSTAVGNRCGGPWLACDRSPARSLQRLQTISSSISLSRERERKAGGNRSRPLWTLGRWLTEERNIGEPAYDQASVTGRGTTLLARTKEKKGFARVRELSTRK